MDVTKILIPSKHYVGLVKRNNERLPLAFITPWGEDPAAKKRIATVDSWASSRYHNSPKMESQIIDNNPLIGFKLGASIRSSDYGGYDKWRIEDPRGFELEITSGNLAQLLSVGMIDKGEILDQCVWARYGKDNVLLSTNTDEYKNAVANTKVASCSASWKNAKLGDTVVLQNNIKGIWLGRMHYLYKNYGNISGNANIGDDELTYTANANHLIFAVETSTLYMFSSPKLSSIDSCETPLTKAEAEIKVNQLIADTNISKTIPGYNIPLLMAFGEINPILTLIEIDVLDLEALGKENNRVFVELTTGEFGLFSHRNVIYLYDKNSINQNKLCRKIGIAKKHAWMFTGCEREMLSVEFDGQNIKKSYKLEISAKTSVGHKITQIM